MWLDMSSGQPHLDFEAMDPLEASDAEARRLAVDATRNVALEASAGTGKTRVLVDRYVGLLLAGVRPRNILALTFTRKAAAEMRQRILDELARRHREGGLPEEAWRDIRDATGEIAISTIDAFCLALVREFPLEADVDPGFALADETEAPRLIEEALDRTIGRGRHLALEDPDVALVFADLGERRLRHGLARLLDRRLVAWDAINRFVHGADVTAGRAVARLSGRLRAAFATHPGGLENFVAAGPASSDFTLVARDLRLLAAADEGRPELVPALLERVSHYMLTRRGEPRRKLEHRIDQFRSRKDYDRHKAAVTALGPYFVEALDGFRSDLNLVLARGVRRLLGLALSDYRRILVKHNVLDFSEVLLRALGLLRQMDEFSRSRYRLESRYQHVLVDEFQDTSRAQWELVQLLVKAWGEGEGLTEAALPPSIFIVGDRKQSIYGFRDAEVAVLEAAARYIEALRPMTRVRQAITRSFRSVRELLAFSNDLFALVEKQERADAFRYGEQDVFPLASAPAGAGEQNGTSAVEEPLGVTAVHGDEAQAEAVADEIARLIADRVLVRDRDSGIRRAISPGDVAVLFRTRESHRIFEAALDRRRVPYYVYKGLGFFDADEIKDVMALLSYLAAPQSNLRAAAFLRSRFVKLSDPALRMLAPGLAAALTSQETPRARERFEADDRVRLELARAAVPGWLALVDLIPPAELLDRVLAESAYLVETRVPTGAQARENLKKIRGLLRRVQNKGYTTLARSVDYFSRMVAGGDESNAVVDAVDAVSLMTVHAAKGLEFPVVFLVNLAKSSGGSRDPVRVVLQPVAEPDAAPAVAVGERESEADRDEEARETEETKRLLYVAVTRARDRLYFATTVSEDGRFVPGRGSLGRVLPPSFASFVAGPAGTSSVSESGHAAGHGGGHLATWVGPSGPHRFRIVGPPRGTRRVLPAPSPPQRAADQFEGLSPDLLQRISVSDVAASAGIESGAQAPVGGESPGGPSTALVGSLVHRALELKLGLDVPLAPADLEAAIGTLLRDEERMLAVEEGHVLARAAGEYSRVIGRPDVRALLADGTVLAELPFSLRQTETTMLRGTIDWLVVAPDGRVTVVELKTGGQSPDHQAQLALYVEAARAIFPGAAVKGRLIYTDGQLSGGPGV
jgi:ATP-dependent helicase/nuclease subunit A